jgi:hypothetical protein
MTQIKNMRKFRIIYEEFLSSPYSFELGKNNLYLYILYEVNYF